MGWDGMGYLGWPAQVTYQLNMSRVHRKDCPQGGPVQMSKPPQLDVLLSAPLPA